MVALFCGKITFYTRKNTEMAHIRKLSPLVGESVNRQVDERGKCEQI